MSVTPSLSAPDVLNRSVLAVPANAWKFIERAATGPADVIFLDLEDSVPADQKAAARDMVVRSLNQLDFGARTVSVRINGLDTPFMYRDIIDILEARGSAEAAENGRGVDRLDRLLIPKVASAADVYAVEVLVSQVEAATGRPRRLGLDLLIETAAGIANLETIAAASPRICSLIFGSGDFAASTRARVTRIGAPSPDYAVLTDPDPAAGGARQRHWGDLWHYALARLVVAARAHGVLPIDGAFADVRDTEGFLAASHRAAALGCDGKLVIHPSQIIPANTVFSPTEAEKAEAARVVAALQDAERAGRAAVTLDGRMIDIASIRQAEATLSKAARCASGS